MSKQAGDKVVARAKAKKLAKPTIASLEQEAAGYLEQWQRSQAELANYTKRVTAERTQTHVRLTQSLLTPLLPLADNFQAMIEHTPAELVGNSWVTGVTHIGKQLESILAELGAVRMDPSEEAFDPMRHEAVEEVEIEGIASGTIVEVLQPGYLVGEQVFRPAKVKVAK